MPKWYNIQRMGGGKSKIDLMDGIGLYPEQPAADLINCFKNCSPTGEIELNIASDGGDVLTGTEVHNAIKACPGTVNGRINSIAASIASVIAMACDNLCMAPNAYLMIHNPTIDAGGNADDHRGAADVLDTMKTNIAGMYSAKCGKPIEQITPLMDAKKWFGAKEAKDFGLIDEIASVDCDTAGMAMARVALKYPDAPAPLRAFALASLNPLPTEKPKMALNIYQRDGKYYVKVGDAEHEVDAPAPVVKTETDFPQAIDQEKIRGEALAQGIREGADKEKAYRLMFNTVLGSAKIIGDSAAKFEKEFYGLAENQLKFLAENALQVRTQALGEAGVEGGAETEEQKADREFIKTKTAYFAQNRTMRSAYRCQNENPESEDYKTALNRYLANAKKSRTEQKAGRKTLPDSESDCVGRLLGKRELIDVR